MREPRQGYHVVWDRLFSHDSVNPVTLIPPVRLFKSAHLIEGAFPEWELHRTYDQMGDFRKLMFNTKQKTGLLLCE